jgi:hypothetical protein
MTELDQKIKDAAAVAQIGPKQSLNFAMDPDRRMALAILSTEREQFAIKAAPDVIIPIPFHLLKEAVAQILEVEVQIALAKLPGGAQTPRHRWPKGMQGVSHVAKLLMDSAQLEAAGEALADQHQVPEFKPNLEVII